MAKWTTAYVNALPDGSFAYIDKNGRHLPYKDADGKVDLPHVRAALSRVNQVTGIPSATVATIKKKLQALLGSKSASEYFLIRDAYLLSESADIQIFPFGNWQHPRFGEINMTPERAQNFIKNFHGNAYGQELPLDYNHGSDKAKGDKAAGWFTNVFTKEDGLYATVELTTTAAQEVKDKEWKFFSPTYWDHWENPLDGGKTVRDLLVGGALTNRPFLKGIAPLNFSEITFSVPEWQHLNPQEPLIEPVKEEDSDLWPDQDKGQPLNTYHQDPATTTVRNNLSEGGEVDEKQLRALLGIADDADIESHIKQLKEDAASVSELRELNEEAKTFAETFPEQHARMLKLEQQALDSQVLAFAERYTHPSEKGLVLPPAVLELVTDSARKFSDNDATQLSAILDKILEVGLVETRERGGSTTSEDNDEEIPSERRKLSEKVSTEIKKLQAEDSDLDFKGALRKLGEQNPKLLEAYTARGIPSNTAA